MKDSKELKENNFVRLPYFDWDKAKDFYYVAKLGSFSEAGKFLNISQSSLSRKIKILEDHLNCRLFTRLPHGLEITRKGEELYAIIERTFLDLKGFNYNAAVTTNDGQKRKIRVSTTHPVSAYILSEHLISYNFLHPEIILEIIAEDRLIDLSINDVDIAIRPYESNIKGIEQELLFTLKKKLFASIPYLDKNGEPTSIEDLKYHPVISHPQAERYPYSDLNWILKLGMSEEEIKTPIFSSNSLETAVAAAQRGIGILGSYEQMSLIRQSKLKNILPNIFSTPVEWYYVYPNFLNKDVYILGMLNYLKGQIS